MFNYLFSTEDLIFNDYNLSEILKIESVQRNLLPTFSTYSQKVAGIDGELFQSSKLEPLEIEVRARAFVENKNKLYQLRRFLAGKIYTRYPAKLEFKGNEDLYYMAIPKGDIKFINNRKNAEFIITFIAFDPIANGKTVTVKNSGNKIRLNYEGTYETSGILKLILEEKTNQIIVRDNNTFEHVKLINLKAQEGTKITIDYTQKRVTVNSNFAMTNVDYSSVFTNIKQGPNELLLPNNCSAELTFMERWL
ncbi:distal tail protein Dit [Peptostreptococcus russellii]|uniref:distal tail protein Dit n=1 Tax=Peptostreptococcus russellii TaxID=215200 RepID=UPI003F587BD6